jgi:hypothetical protein
VGSKERGEGENKRRNMRNKHKSIELFVNALMAKESERRERERNRGGERKPRTGGEGEGVSDTMHAIAYTDSDDVCSSRFDSGL